MNEKLKNRLQPLSRVRAGEAWTGLFGLFFLSAFVLWVPATGYSSIVGPKHNLFLWACGVFFPVLLVLAFFSRPRWGKGKLLPLIFAGVTLGLFFVSALLSEHQEVAWVGSRRHEGFVTLGLYLLIFAASALWGRLGKAHVRALCLTAALMLALAAAQFAGLNPLHLYPKDYIFHDRGLRYSGEYLATIGNSDLLSAFLTMAVLFLLGTYAAGKAGLPALLGAACAWMTLMLSEVTAGPAAVLGCLAVCLPVCLWQGLGIRRMGDIGAVLLAGAAGKAMLGYAYDGKKLAFFFSFGPLPALLLLGTLGALVLAVFLHRADERPRKRLAAAVGILYGAAALGVLGFLWFYSGGNEALRGLHLLVHGNPPDTLGSSRIRIWREALQLGRQHPLFGVGPDCYRFYSQIVFTASGPNGVRTTSVDAAHCEYLNLWVNTGLPAMLAYLGMVLSAILPALKKPNPRTLPLLLPSLGYAIHALFGISQSVVSPVYYLFLGCLVYACNPSGKDL